MSHTIKPWARVMEQRLRQKTKISENQFGFMPGRSTMEAIFSLKQLMEKYRVKRKKSAYSLHRYRKSLCQSTRYLDLIWWVLNKRNVPRCYIEIIKEMYEGAITGLRTTCGETKGVPSDHRFA